MKIAVLLMTLLLISGSAFASFTAEEETYLKAKVAYELKAQELQAARDSREALIAQANKDHFDAVELINASTEPAIAILEDAVDQKAIEAGLPTEGVIIS